MEVNAYIDKLYRQAREEQEEAISDNIHKNLQIHDEQFKTTISRIDEIDRLHINFEDKTEGNFRVAEEMLLAHTNRLNQLDGRLVNHELVDQFTYLTYVFRRLKRLPLKQH